MPVVADDKNRPVLCEPVVSDGANRRFAFLVYRCPECSYMEFLDTELPLDRRQFDVPTRYARRTSDHRMALEAYGLVGG